MWSVGVPQDDGECGYPVASASVPRSGAGVHVEHPAAERHGPLPLDCYAFAPARRDTRAAWWSTTSGPSGDPGTARPAGGAL